MNAELSGEIRAELVRRVVRSITSNGGFLQVELSQGYLSVGCSWRLSSDDWIVGSSSKQESCLQKMAAIVDETIVAVEVTGGFHDLQVRFNNGVIFETFADTGEFESWNLSFGLPMRRLYVAGPGHLYSSF